MIGRRSRVFTPGAGGSADAVASGAFQQRRGHRGAPAEALLRSVDRTLDVSPPLAAKEGELLRSRRLEARRGHAEEPAWLAEAIAGAADPTPVIMDSALGKSQTCALAA